MEYGFWKTLGPTGRNKYNQDLLLCRCLLCLIRSEKFIRDAVILE